LTQPFAPAALVFDMDGLLLDTERIALETFEAACTANGVSVAREVYFTCVGSRGDAILRRALGSTFPFDAVSRDWSALYNERVMTRAVDVKEGAITLLEMTRQLDLPIALATSTRTALAKHKLEMAGLARFFQVVIGGDAVTHGKPHPEPYLAAARALGRSASRCWAVEDSENGVRAAHAAGCFVLQVPDLVQPSQSVRDIGHRILADLHAVAHLLQAHRPERSVT
jgi:HAD superfamily hydrolase (TIGR01509 family)